MQQHYESVDPRVRASELRASAKELDAAGYHLMAECNWEMAEWLDPTPVKERAPRRTSPVRPIPVSHRPARKPRKPPPGTSVEGKNQQGRVLRRKASN